jgi:DnaJ-class molecular chaperone
VINPWKILSVHRKSTDEEIQLAFHKLAKKYHPDKQSGNTKRFHQINEAYSTLKTKEKRRFFTEVRLSGFDKCPNCKAQGVHVKNKGLTEKIYTACTICGGSGFIIPTEEEGSNVIELRGTTGTRGKRRDTKRGY